MGVSVDGMGDQATIISDLRLLASTAFQRSVATPRQDQVLAGGWELSRSPGGHPVWRRDTERGTAYLLFNSGAWLSIVGRAGLAVRQHPSRQEACQAADAVLTGEQVSA